MANRPSLWIVLMSLMSIAYCGEDVIKITKIQGAQAKKAIIEAQPDKKKQDKLEILKNPYLINIAYGKCSTNCFTFQNVNLSSFSSISKGDSLNIVYKNSNNLIHRIELYVALFYARYSYIQDSSKTITVENLPERVFIYHGTWFPYGSDIAEFYLYLHRGSENYKADINILQIKVEVEDGEMKTYLMHRTRQSVTLDIVKEKYVKIQNNDKIKEDNRALIDEAYKTNKFILGNLECAKSNPIFRIVLGQTLIDKAGKGTFHLSAFTETISDDDLIKAVSTFANTDTDKGTPITTSWANISCTNEKNPNDIADGIEFLYSNINQKILSKMYFNNPVVQKITKENESENRII